MDKPTSSKQSSDGERSLNYVTVNGLTLPGLDSPLPLVEERFEIYMIDTEPVLRYSSAGFRLFVSKFTDQLLINYISNSAFDIINKAVPNKFRWLHVIRSLWHSLENVERLKWETKANASSDFHYDDCLFDELLRKEIQKCLYEQSLACKEKQKRAAFFESFLKSNVDELFVIPTPMSMVVDYLFEELSGHAINSFQIFMHLDYFFDFVFETDVDRTVELVKHAIFYTPERTNDQLSVSLTKLLPGMKDSEQFSFIIDTLREHALENFFRRFNPIDYGEAQAKHIRKQAVEIGIVDLLLDFLAYFAHQKPRCKVLRPSHMDYSHFQTKIVDRKQTDKKLQQNGVNGNELTSFSPFGNSFNMVGDSPMMLSGGQIEELLGNIKTLYNTKKDDKSSVTDNKNSSGFPTKQQHQEPLGLKKAYIKQNETTVGDAGKLLQVKPTVSHVAFGSNVGEYGLGSSTIDAITAALTAANSAMMMASASFSTPKISTSATKKKKGGGESNAAGSNGGNKITAGVINGNKGMLQSANKGKKKGGGSKAAAARLIPFGSYKKTPPPPASSTAILNHLPTPFLPPGTVKNTFGSISKSGDNGVPCLNHKKHSTLSAGNGIGASNQKPLAKNSITPVGLKGLPFNPSLFYGNHNLPNHLFHHTIMPPNFSGGGAPPGISLHKTMLKNSFLKPPKHWEKSNFAKGTGYGSGSTMGEWNLKEHVARQKFDAENVTILLNILKAFIQPVSLPLKELVESGLEISEFDPHQYLRSARAEGGESQLIDEHFVQLLHRSCLRKTLISYLINDSLLDITKNKEIYESVFALLTAISQTPSIHAYASLFAIDREEEEESADGDEADLLFPRLVDDAGPSTSMSPGNNGLMEVDDERKGDNDAYEEVEHVSREEIDVFHFLFLDNWFVKGGKHESDLSPQPFLLEQLRKVNLQIETYLKRIARRSAQVQLQDVLNEDDLSLFTGDEDRLRNLLILSKVVCAVIEQKQNVVADSTEVGFNTNTASLATAQLSTSGMDVVASTSASVLSSATTAKNALSHPNTLEECYCKKMKPLQFETIPFFRDGSTDLCVSYHYKTNIISANHSAFGSNTRRITQEIISLNASLPLSCSSSVFIRSSEERIQAAKMLITGPHGTPYSNGCFEFDVYFPDSYPSMPMQVNLQTTGNGTVRFNPNLYNCGKVCLSVLNTWSGRPEEMWNPETSSLLQVMVSLQSLVMVPEPYFNEPGYQNSIGTTNGKRESNRYNSQIRWATVRWAMYEALKNPPLAFVDIIRRHFWMKRFEVEAQVEEWIREERELKSTLANKLEQDFMRLKKEFDVLENYFKSEPRL